MMSPEEREIQLDPLLLQIQRRGWNERLARRFDDRYGRLLRWRIVAHMEKLGLLQYRMNPSKINLLSSRRVELFENSLSDLWIELIKGVVDKYIEQVRAGKVHQPFVSYMSGVIRHLVVANARSLRLIERENAGEILRAICESKQEATRRAKFAWAKFCFGYWVRYEVLTRCSKDWFDRVYRNIHHVVDYFFEKFIFSKCGELKKYKINSLMILLDRFLNSTSDLEKAIGFIGTIAPFATGGEVSLQTPPEVSEDEYLSALSSDIQQGWL